MKFDFRLKKIDWYIIRKFIGTYFFSLLLIICIIVVFDLSEKIEKMITRNAPVSAVIFDYYLRYIPYFASLFCPLFVFITVIFFTSRMAANTEIVAMLSSGISFKRLMYPYFISAFILAVLSLCLNLFIIPPATRVRQAFEDKYIRKPNQNKDKNIHFQLKPGEHVFMTSFETRSGTARQFALEHHENGELKSKLMSNYARYDTATHKWKIYNYFIRVINDSGRDSISTGAEIDTAINLSYDDLASRDNFVEAMDYFELKNYREQQILRGASNVNNIIIEQQQRMSMPFSTFILTLIGVSLSSRKVRGGIGMHIGVGIGIGFTYILFMQFSKTFVQAGITSAEVAIWLPNIIFSVVAIVLYKMAQK